MSRRTAERHPRRVEVRFWRRGHEQPHSGFTIDLSKTGMFLGTSISLDPGERLRVEIVDKERGFVVEGQVARVHRVSLALRHLEQPGVGVRFLGPGDLVSDLIHGGRPRGGAAPRPEAESVEARPEPAPAVPPAAAAAAATETSPDAVEELFGPDPRRAVAPPPAKPAAAPLSTRPARTVPVEFVDRASFLAVFHRDIAAGGLFVTSDSPAALHEVVLVELRVPVPGSHPLQFEARVVHRFDAATGSKSGLTGMGVQFLDPDRVRTALTAIIDDLRP